MKVSRLIIENDFIGSLECETLLGYSDAIILLTNNTKSNGEWSWMLSEYPNSKFSISVFNSNNNETKLYTISAKRISTLTKAGAY